MSELRSIRLAACVIALACGTGILGLANRAVAIQVDVVFQNGAAIPALGIVSYDGYDDMRLNGNFPLVSGGAETNFAGDAGNGAINRAPIRWDLSALSGAAIVGDATLTLNITGSSSDLDQSLFEPADINDFFDLHRIHDSNAGWVENDQANIVNVTMADGDPSWNNFSENNPTIPWRNAAGTGDFPGLGAAGDGYVSTPVATLNEAGYTAGQPVQLTIPQAVIEDIIAGGTNHPGFLFRARDESGAPDTAGRIRFSNSSAILTITADIFPAVLEMDINRATGAITLTNNTGSPVDFLGYSITSATGTLDPGAWNSIAENYDVDNPGPDQVDPDDHWTELTAASSRNDLSEFQLGGPGPQDGATLADGQSIDLGTGAWIQYFTEDVEALITLNDGSGTKQTPIITYTGSELPEGDLNFDGIVDELDWPIYRDGFDQDLSGLSTAEAYHMGDFNDDGVNDHADFVAFKTLYDAAQGPGAFEAMLASVPEPSSALIVVLGSLFLLPICRRKRPTVC